MKYKPFLFLYIFFALTFLKSNSITFCFYLSLTSGYTNYQKIKFFQLYLKFKKKSEFMKHQKQPLSGFLQNRFYDNFKPKINTSKIPVNHLIFQGRIGKDLQLYYNQTIPQQVFKHVSSKHFKIINTIIAETQQTKMRLLSF